MMMKSSKLKGYEKNGIFRDHIGNYSEAEDMEFPSALYPDKSKVSRLPVPELEDTLKMFLKSARPHVTSQEFKETEDCVREFLEKDGKLLQERLLQRAQEKNSKNTSWFIEWWNDWAYMSYFGSVVHNVTYYLKFRDESPAAMKNPCRRAARFVYHAMDFRNQVVNGTLPAEQDKGSKTFWETSQYKYMFNTCRMPGGGPNNADTVRTYAPDIHRHICVARKNRFYTFDVIDENGIPLPVSFIQQQIERAKNLADSHGTDPYPIGILTAQDRDKWAETRPLLLKGPDTAQANESLARIESSIFMICLDETSPVTREDVGLNLLHSDGKNRFWDKSIQVVFFENGVAGYVGEHSMMDGMTTTRFVNATLEKMFKDQESYCTVPVQAARVAYSQPEPRIASFPLSKDAMKAIKEAELWYTAALSEKELSVLQYYGYGANRIKQFKQSPDAYAQLAIQLAYRMTFGHCRGTYESTATRRFLHGRTEVTRSCSIESEAFCDAVERGDSLKELFSALSLATRAHSDYTSKASKGHGVDRHLLGLSFLVKPGEKVPRLFKDPAYLRSKHWAISTSGLVGELMDGWGFGEVVSDGIGVGYSVKGESLTFTITSAHKKEKWAHRMTANMENALLWMKTICEANVPPPSSKDTEKAKAKL